MRLHQAWGPGELPHRDSAQTASLKKAEGEKPDSERLTNATTLGVIAQWLVFTDLAALLA